MGTVYKGTALPAILTIPLNPMSFSHSAALLDWYDRHHRKLPWRISPDARKAGAEVDPYRIWLSEIMLQQTTVQAVKPYFETFLDQWPDVIALSQAEEEDVLKAWAGLGYYSRARNLKKCADIVARDHGGAFPHTETELKKLPGIGDYTAAAITAIAFDEHAAVVDGNIERILSRIDRINQPISNIKPQLRLRMGQITPADRPGDFAQAMMDLGATICTPKRPACALCPLQPACQACQSGDQETYPVKPPKKAKPIRMGAAYVAVDQDGSVLLRRRPDKGLLAGMTEVPTTEWSARQDGHTGREEAPFPATWQTAGTIAHVFTHFELRLSVYRADVENAPVAVDGWWSSRHELAGEALPTVMKKVVEAALGGPLKQRQSQTRKRA